MSSWIYLLFFLNSLFTNIQLSLSLSLSLYLSIYLSIYLSKNQSIYLSFFLHPSFLPPSFLPPLNLHTFTHTNIRTHSYKHTHVYIQNKDKVWINENSHYHFSASFAFQKKKAEPFSNHTLGFFFGSLPNQSILKVFTFSVVGVCMWLELSQTASLCGHQKTLMKTNRNEEKCEGKKNGSNFFEKK